MGFWHDQWLGVAHDERDACADAGSGRDIAEIVLAGVDASEGNDRCEGQRYEPDSAGDEQERNGYGEHERRVIRGERWVLRRRQEQDRIVRRKGPRSIPGQDDELVHGAVSRSANAYLGQCNPSA